MQLSFKVGQTNVQINNVSTERPFFAIEIDSEQPVLRKLTEF